MSYYHALVTEKSWKLLQKLKREYSFILIGGWAVYLYTKTLKSKDIDIIVEYSELEKLRMSDELFKNERLKKYEIHREGIDIDIYAPFFSDLGLPVEAVSSYIIFREGFSLPRKEILLIMKQKAWMDRGNTLKGDKDRLDILSLIKDGIDWKMYRKALDKFHLTNYLPSIKILLGTLTDASELNLNSHQYSRLKKTTLNTLNS